MTKLTRKEIMEKLAENNKEVVRFERELEAAQESNDKVFLSTERDQRVIAEKYSVQIHVIANLIANLGMFIVGIKEFRSQLAETKEVNTNSTLGYPDMPLNEELDRALEQSGDDLFELYDTYEFFWAELNRLAFV